MKPGSNVKRPVALDGGCALDDQLRFFISHVASF
jgi:hypothetical protein